MGSKTGIAWTDSTWNPIIGCSRVSEGCRNCYAERTAGRFGEGKKTVYSGLTQIVNGRAVWTGQIAETKQLLTPLKWGPVHDPDRIGPMGYTRRRRIFVNSFSDLFHENVTDEQRDRIFAVMALCRQHDFQVLTKRPERMLRYMTDACTEDGSLRIGRAAASLFHGMSLRDRHLSMAEQAAVSNQFEWKELHHVWLGVSVENQAAADERIPVLLQTPAAVRFISAEPLLGPVRLDRGHEAACAGDFENCAACGSSSMFVDFFNAHAYCAGEDCDAPGEALAQARIDWVICGGESGPQARPMHPDWARSLRDQCQAAEVPFFFKQWGEWAEVDGGPPNRVFDVDKHHPPIDAANCVISIDGHVPRSQNEMSEDVRYRWMSRIGKKAAGGVLDGRTWHEMPKGVA